VARVLRTPPTPTHVDARTIVLIGTALWLVAAIALAIAWNWLGSHGHRIWLWTSLSGAGLGLAGLLLVGKHRGEGRL
jgi:Protein of unknown function (DUF2530)